MNEDSLPPTEDRHVKTGKFLSRVQRYRNLLLRRWWVPVLCLALALAAEAANVWFSPSQFVSVGQMIVSIKLNIQQGSLYTEELNNFLGTQAALMQGTEVLNHAGERAASASGNVPATPVNIAVAVLPKTTIFVLRASGEDPKYTQLFLQACMDEYINLKKQMVENTSDTTISGLTDQMLRLEPEMRKSEDAITSFLGTNDVSLLEGVNGAANYLTILYQQLAEAQSEYDLLQSMTLDQNLLLEQNRFPGLADNTMPNDAQAGGSVLVNAGLARQNDFASDSIGMQYLTIKQRILLLKAERERYAEYLQPKHPQMIAVDQELERLGRMLDIYRAQSVEQLEARKSSLALQIQNLQNQTKQWGKENIELYRKNAEYDRLKAKSARLQSLYDQLLASLESLDVNKDISPESVTIYQPASAAIPDTSWITKGLLLAGVAGLGLGLLILMLMDRVDDRMNSFHELQELFDEEVLGQIPRERIPAKTANLPLLQLDDQRHSLVESYRNLRSSLLYMEQAGTRPRTLLITSSVPSEGKTLTTANLAVTLATGGSRVLLVDADLRKGNLHTRFNIQVDTGLSEVLSQKTDWRAAVKDTAIANLRLLPRGATTQRSSEFFIGAVMEKFLQDSAKEYDYVLIDTAPVMAADDVTSLAPRVDGVIFVVRAEFTSARVAHAALDMLHQRKAHILGLVFNSVHASAADYHYYQYRDYYAAK